MKRKKAKAKTRATVHHRRPATPLPAFRFGLPPRPDGPVNSATREWIAYRLAVREVAARWCDRPTVVGQFLRSCEDCQACEACALVLSGEA